MSKSTRQAQPWPWAQRLYDDYVAELAGQGVIVLKKSDSRFCRFLNKVLKVVTFGGQDRFLTSYTTTLGRRVYVPDDWDTYDARHRYCVLRHEAVHVRQFKRLTWPGIILVYVLLPIPAGFALGRAWLEWEGYRETLRAHWQIYGAEAAKDPALTEEIVGRFTGPDYGWMWLAGGQIRRRIHAALARLERDPPLPLYGGSDGH